MDFIYFLLILLTKHGGIVDAKRTRHCVTSRYVSAKPNDTNRKCHTLYNTPATADLIGEMDSGTDCTIGPWFWPSGRGPVIWK